MQKGILIRTGNHCLWKAVFAGDLAYAQAEFDRLAQKYPGLTVSLHDDTDTEFVTAEVDQPGLVEVQ